MGADFDNSPSPTPGRSVSPSVSPSAGASYDSSPGLSMDSAKFPSAKSVSARMSQAAERATLAASGMVSTSTAKVVTPGVRSLITKLAAMVGIKI